LLLHIVGLTLYFCSSSGDGLEKIGREIDNALKKTNLEPKAKLENAIPSDKCSSTKMILMKMALSTAVILNSAGIAVSTYQTFGALGDASKEEGSVIPEGIFDFSKWAFLIAGGISNFIFVSSFFMTLNKKLEKLLTPKPLEAPLQPSAEANYSEEEDSESDDAEINTDRNPFENRKNDIVLEVKKEDEVTTQNSNADNPLDTNNSARLGTSTK